MRRLRRATLTLAILAAAGLPSAAQHHDDSVAVKLPYHSEEVFISTHNPSIRLAGTVTLPKTGGPHPAVLLITGDGEHTRDQNISGSPQFRMLADSLTKSGLAVLRVDDRGVGKSTGPSVEEATFDERTSDMQACLDYLRSRADIDSTRIGLLGHSAGALVAQILAARDSTLRFVVFLAPTGVPGREIWIKQQIDNLLRLGGDPSIVPEVERQLHAVVAQIESDYADDAAFYEVGYDFVAAHGLPGDQITDALIDQLLGGIRNRRYRDFFQHDPRTVLREISSPVFAVFAGADQQVSVEQNVVSLTDALVAAGNSDFTVSVLPNQDHFFFEYQGARLDKHVFGEMEMAGELFTVLIPWMRAKGDVERQ